jgi:hypothetical protein
LIFFCVFLYFFCAFLCFFVDSIDFFGCLGAWGGALGGVWALGGSRGL